MLEINQLAAGYGEKEVLHNISFLFEGRQNYCILGPNGCGKTTLIRAMAGLIPFKGSVLINGQPLDKMKRREIAKHIAVLSQINDLYFPYSVYDTVMMGRYQHQKSRLFTTSSVQDAQMVEQCLEMVDLTNERDTLINELSGGQRQRVFLAQVLAQDPKIILLDEPSNHLDVRFQIELIEHLKAWSQNSHRIVISVFHDINLALHLTDNVLYMKEGKIPRSGKFSEVTDRPFLHWLYEADLKDYMLSSLALWKEVPDALSQPL
ncbi:MAG: ABC transporter ATP-binding protein [Christensenellales bacterium]|jgi:iron complex transport system ATP-binding protein